ncbi:unnamed protein product, partial [Prunus brigantina]
FTKPLSVDRFLSLKSNLKLCVAPFSLRGGVTSISQPSIQVHTNNSEPAHRKSHVDQE